MSWNGIRRKIRFPDINSGVFGIVCQKVNIFHLFQVGEDVKRQGRIKLRQCGLNQGNAMDDESWCGYQRKEY